MLPRMFVSFLVPGEPVAKGRPRLGRMGGQARVFTPPRTVRYESLVRAVALEALGGRTVPRGPLLVRLAIGLPVPTSWSTRRRAAALAGLIAATKRPDADNVVKGVLDGCNGIAFDDDAHIVELVVTKRYAEQPGVRVDIHWLDQEMAP